MKHMEPDEDDKMRGKMHGKFDRFQALRHAARKVGKPPEEKADSPKAIAAKRAAADAFGKGKRK